MEGVEEWGHRTHVEGVGAQPDEVGGNPAELGEDDADVLSAFRNLATKQLFNCESVGEVVAVSVEIVHAVRHGNALQILLVLGFLFHSGVEVADDALTLDDRFAVKLSNDSEDTVGGWVLGPHVHDHRVFADALEDRLGGRHKSLLVHRPLTSSVPVLPSKLSPA